MASSQPAQQQPSSASGSGALPGEQEAQVQELMMISAKPREACVAALRAAFGDPNRAFEYLMSGASFGEGGAEGDVGMDDDGYGDEEGSADMSGGNPFAALASNPNFALIRQRILQDPNFY